MLACMLVAIHHGRPARAWAQAPSQPPAIALTGDFLGEGPWPEDGSTWLGLYAETGRYELRPVRLRVSTIDHACSGSATRVRAMGAAAPLFLMRGLPSLQPGPVKGAFRGRLFLYPGQSRSIQLGERVWYAFQAFGAAQPVNQEALFTDYSLWLRRGDRAQVLGRYPRLAGDGVPEVIWAGDLDRDGQLDLLADMRQHYASNHYELFLSTSAAADSLVGGVANFDVPGC